jgi:RAMP superfamily
MTGLYIARITIEAISPMSVGSGEAGVSDVSLVRDANGLPMISGASLQGLMKALAGREKAAGLALMGDDDVPAKIQFSDARIHGSNEEAVTGIILRGVSDELLKRYLVDEPLLRDHVKIDHRGAGEDHGKFDRAALPRGTRFSFELTMWGNAEDEDAFTAILALIHHPLFRPGGATRRGYGRMKVHAGGWEFWADSVSSVEPINNIRRTPFSCHVALCKVIPADAGAGLMCCTLQLRSESWWRAGGDGAWAWTGDYEKDHKNPDADSRDPEKDRAAFTREPSICWDAGHNADRWVKPGDKITKDYVLAGSSIRGALWHRTLFHWNKQNGIFVDLTQKDDKMVNQQSEPPPAMLALFGEVKTDGGGQRAALIIDDIVFTPNAVTVADHVSIDRFTGGARTGALFSEELVQIKKEGIKLHIIIDEQLLTTRAPQDKDKIMAAFNAAVADLCKGRLALGAKSSGYFEGTCEPDLTAEAGQ